MPQKYSFITHWEIKAPLEEVWNAIYNSLEWPEWWRGVKSVIAIRPNDANGINGERLYTWKSALPYCLSFMMKLTECEPLKRMKGVAFGELEGTGEWVFSQQNDIVTVMYYWNIITTKKWMNTLAFLLKPFFTINHNIVMHWGAKGLAKKLNAVLVKG